MKEKGLTRDIFLSVLMKMRDFVNKNYKTKYENVNTRIELQENLTQQWMAMKKQRIDNFICFQQ